MAERTDSQQLAAEVMERHNISADSVIKGRRRCNVRGIRLRDFYFNSKDGVSTIDIEDCVQNLTTCFRLVDDHSNSIYHAYNTRMKR